ncbi:DEHA2F27346p [Debaryomyces hansenii CBS767]|uniref:DEHA2F27346p n=1 Tax=Debaryomyces hansenii (strain ATCC 36239 / CBS 767 / BCRC 21394 / JCM 1990 / NBRC 0083 / IGC 2968) TaxID=284592 RepID=Q6BJU4_DEBHA|nr:DEHA2F27346p [Debaryomyces hansenii CBS767]CAG89960.1 DEHA2F27346p [Debaryomyces hansenii CBS767]|eukprot:XP_461527.1 DEHA2F27346p [Debaryomyces hansenii CBS767]
MEHVQRNLKMRLNSFSVSNFMVFFLFVLVSCRCVRITEPSLETIETDATIRDNSSSIAGKLFDRFVVIWLENTNEKTASADADLRWLAERGITLTNYWALTHPSEPNYIASVSGDTFGLDKDSFITIPSNISTVVDLLETENITWGEYQEDLPYSGFQGLTFSSHDNSAKGYVRKHNPLISFDSITNNSSRLSKIKNFTEFHNDLGRHELPSWMFIAPNMMNDGHDSNIETAGRWCRKFVEPLFDNEYFISKTLMLITFDENESYSEANKVWALLLGGVIDKSHLNTSDNTYYTHYSELSTVENNWDLCNLGRNDTNNNGNANVFKVLAEKSGYTNRYVDTVNQYFNKPIRGYWSGHKILPGINCSAIGTSDKGVLIKIKNTWCNVRDRVNSSRTSTAPLSRSHNEYVVGMVLSFSFIFIYLY